MSDGECKKDAGVAPPLARLPPPLPPSLPPPLPPPPPTGLGLEPRRSRCQRTRYTEEEVVSLAAIMQAHSRTGEPRGTLPIAHFASALIKKKTKFSSNIRKSRSERLQSHIWLTDSLYLTKYFRIFSYIRKPFFIYDFATAPIWISLYILGQFNILFLFQVSRL